MSKYDPKHMTDAQLIDEGSRCRTYEGLRQCWDVLVCRMAAPRAVVIECECSTWACEDAPAMFLGNGHNQRCEHFRPNVGAVNLLIQLCDGIDWWASQEDGVPDELWEAYSLAHFIARGRFPKEAAQA
jgi:hypothetical protein